MLMNKVTLFFKITYLCNDSCPFCLVYNHRQRGVPVLSFDDIVRNTRYFLKKYDISRIVVTGGEPSTHPDFFKILKYFRSKTIPVNLITNAVNFSSEKFLLKTKKTLFNDSQDINIISFSLNDYPRDNNTKNILTKRVKGIANLAKSGIPCAGIVTIFKDNVKKIDRIVEFIIYLKEKDKINLKCLDLRMLFLGKGFMPRKVEKEVLPYDFEEVKDSLEIALNCLKKNNIEYNLWNFPLCYLKYPKLHKNRGVEKRIKDSVFIIDTNYQLENYILHNWKDYLKSHFECKKCKLTDYCGGIVTDYIERYNYPKLQPIN